MKVRAMIRPNKVSEIRSIGSSTLSNRESETSDILIKLRNLRGPFADYFQPAEQTFLRNVGAEHSIGVAARSNPQTLSSTPSCAAPGAPLIRRESPQVKAIDGCVILVNQPSN